MMSWQPTYLVKVPRSSRPDAGADNLIPASCLSIDKPSLVDAV
jgi:hypothetical protein